jgi:hypothetical protein
VDLVIRLTQRSFLYLVAVYVLDPNLRPLAPPFVSFENGVTEIVQSTSAMYLSPLILIFEVIMRSPLVRPTRRGGLPQTLLNCRSYCAAPS